MALTPMMEQYLEIKEKYKDCILLFRLGDFYEMFFDHAEICSRELELTLTGKDCGLDKRAPMCGIPYHAVNSYIPKLIEKGYKVAICEQVEDPKDAVGIVKREVIKIITPGTITETTMLDEKKNNYILAINLTNKDFGIAYSDVTTGEFYVSNIQGVNSENKVIDEIAKIMPSEIIIPNEIYEEEFVSKINKRFSIYISRYNNFEVKTDTLSENKIIVEINKTCRNSSEKNAASLLLNYLIETQKNSVEQVNKINTYDIDKYMQIDISTRKNLEILESNMQKGKKGSLLWVLDETQTAMGARVLRKWLESPLLDKDEIIQRQNGVESLLNSYILRTDIVEKLRSIYDIERIISKVVGANINARDLVSLKNSLEKLPLLKDELAVIVDSTKDKYLSQLYENMDLLKDIYELLEHGIMEDPPLTIKDGGIIKAGYNAQIDEYRDSATHGKNWVMELEANEKELTGIKSLKVGFNRVFGYYIEVTNSFKSQIPEDRYIRRQTLAGSERYITPELKEIEEKVLGAEEKLVALEYKEFCEIRQKVASEVIRVQRTANSIAELDVLCSLAIVAENNKYCKPEIIDSGEIKISNGRHAVVEKALKNEEFIPNDVYLNSTSDRFLIITGPNMAGKSTYMRQVALTVYMAQVGSFVPAEQAQISLVDKIFTRVGASDDLAMGQSTFMVEMSELSNILENATASSLVILDEIGRGTSTYDGLAIAWATVEYVSDIKKVGAKTLFATHYHELTELEEKIEGIKNYSVEVKEKGDDVIFLRKIVRGGADESYGIYVAKIAGVPKEIVSRAKEILRTLEDIGVAKKSVDSHKKVTEEQIQVDMFNYKLAEVAKLLDKTNLDELSPKEGLDILYKLKEKIK